MKKILSIQDYMLLFAPLVILSVMLYNNIELISWLENNQFSSDLIMYFMICCIYVIFSILNLLKSTRVSYYYMEPLDVYSDNIKFLLIGVNLIAHIIFWYIYFTNPEKNTTIIIATLFGFNKKVLLDRIYMSDKYFCVGNTIYTISEICEISDDTGSNFNIVINKNKVCINCDSLKVKEQLLDKISLLRAKE